MLCSKVAVVAVVAVAALLFGDDDDDTLDVGIVVAVVEAVVRRTRWESCISFRSVDMVAFGQRFVWFGCYICLFFPFSLYI